MYKRGDALDNFFNNPSAASHSHQSFLPHPSYPAASAPQQTSYNSMASASGPAAYGTPGSFSGRKPVQPPGGRSSLSLGDGSNYSPYSRYGAYQAPPQGILASAPAQYSTPSSYTPQGQYNSPPVHSSSPQYNDLSSQLNLPGNATRRPPSSGRRAHPPSSYGNSYPSNYGMQQQAGSYGAPVMQSAHAAGAYYNSPAAGCGSQQYDSNPCSPQQAQYQPMGNQLTPQGYAQQGYGQQAAYSPNRLPAPIAGAVAYNPGMMAVYNPQPVFKPGQKGQFCGKTIVQPPGGRTSINIFG